MSSRFVNVTAAELLGMLRDIGSKIAAAGGTWHEKTHGSEVVVDLVPPHARAMVRVYTSVAAGAINARGRGKDAIRIVVCVELPEGFRKLEEPRKVLRTAAAGDDRERVFLDRLKGVLREAYGQALDNPPCPTCGRATVARTGKRGAFRGCCAYPTCWGSTG